MTSIRVSTVIDAPPATVWGAVEDINTHIEWMADAESITFTSELTQGEGTTFDCVTKVGPIRLTDVMTITEWAPGEAMGVRHVGMVTGTGVFTLTPVSGDRTRFSWAESLTFPWWMGGPVGGVVGAVILRRIWRSNLVRLRHLVEEG
jgi:carbon monoxide dehydrogenase subunit G